MYGMVFLRHDSFALTLLGIAVVIVLAWLAGRLFERLGQPPVIGEVIAGILLGPSLLGEHSAALFPLEARPQLKILATVGLVVFMFLVGLDLDLGHLGDGRHRVAGGVALSGTIVPFGMGVAAAFALYPSHDDADFLPFALFMGAAMSITAFPVLARILIEKKLWDRPLGVVAMACAAGDDVLTWATLALVVAIVSSSGALDLPYIIVMALAFGTLMIRVVRPYLARFAERELDNNLLAVMVAAIFVCSYITSTIGVHEIFGAFLLGAIMPRGPFAQQLRSRLLPIALVLLPVFFVTTGLNVDVGGIGTSGIWQLALILFVACAGKFLGAIVGARSQGLRMRECVALGVLMNTRGLTELVVLNLGRELGVLDDRLFTMLVIMAVVTTVATSPLLDIVKPDPDLGGVREEPATESTA